ncbi:polyphosphate polymerase domain-containing protein [Sinanaerobacter sp. ZZT-01]|uniref:polyphosphate polymerase domain-containing protein n=1 Tax=Sinanaerobacter sp. ZZT-01 TaxID=3111540 RepID=UPI002D77E683|nr:polyphosphate polymerase domain-containing protein [Sinanaerobacter sp. ZZT-01]WRR94952.1 polyphosphate polymerase domain-containing protein [Sinanaerobacter sp. ZZT-01]
MLEVHRRELKYLISLTEAANLKAKLGQLMKPDPNNKEDGYLVRSLYFDTLYDSDFEDKVQGYDNRQKIRLRIYNVNADFAKLELKEKSGIHQRKRSLTVSRTEAEQMSRSDYSFLGNRAEPFAKWLYAFMLSRNYKPKCVVEYNRQAYYVEQNDIRVTIDANLRATEASFALFQPNLITYPVNKPGEITLEVKYNNFLFTYIKIILGHIGRTQISNSKYCRARMVMKKGRW